jgi:hypothetical protein
MSSFNSLKKYLSENPEIKAINMNVPEFSTFTALDRIFHDKSMYKTKAANPPSRGLRSSIVNMLSRYLPRLVLELRMSIKPLRNPPIAPINEIITDESNAAKNELSGNTLN